MRATALVLLLALLAASVFVASWAARIETQTDGTFGVAAYGGRVALGVGREVLLCDEAGHLLSTARGPDGGTWSFGDIASVAFDETGRIFVADLGRREVVRFAADGTGGSVLELERVPSLTFEVQPYRDELYLADTMGHHLLRYDARGRVVTSRRVQYPNGLSLVWVDGQPLLVLAETGAMEARAFTPALEPAGWVALKGLNEATRENAWHELLEISATPDGGLVGANCRDVMGECTILRVTGDGARLDKVADTLPFASPVPEAVDGVLGTGELALLGSGGVLVAMPRLGAVVRVDSPAGPPAPAFCASCTPGDLKAASIILEELDRQPLTWSNGTAISVFGDDAVRSRFAAVRSTWAFYAALETGARRVTYGLATLLMVALFLARQSGAGTGLNRLEALWRGLIRPDLRALAIALTSIAMIAAAAGALGYLAFEGPGVLATGVPAAFLAARLVAPRLLLRWRHRDAGARALRHHFEAGLRALLQPGETVVWAQFSTPVRPLSREVRAAKEVADADELLELLEWLAPRLTLLVRTSRRLCAIDTSMLGAPRGSMLVAGLADDALLEAPGEVSLSGPRLARRWWLGAGPAQSATTDAVEPRCTRCAAPEGTCEHTRLDLAVPLLGSLVFPGLGALLQGEFGKARLQAMAGLGLLLQAAKEYLPQAKGTLPPNPHLWLAPLGGYALMLLAGAAPIVLEWVVQRRSLRH